MMARSVRQFFGDTAGFAAIIFGITAPVLFIATGATVEYISLASRQSKLRAAADSGALAATKELSLANVDDARLASVARDVAIAFLAETRGAKGAMAPQVTAQVLEKRRGVQVGITDDVETYFGKLLSYPTFKLSVSSTAKLSGATKLCVLVLDPSGTPDLLAEKNSRLSASQCSVYSNSASPQGLVSKDNAVLQAERVCTVGGYSAGAGNLSGTTITDCPSYDDPLARRPTPANAGTCDQTGLVVQVARTLTPGVFCNGLTIDNGAVVTLTAGTYIISGGPLVVTGGATLQGDGVGFYLAGSLATFDFRPDSTISLAAPKSGDMAGLLFFEDRAAPLLREHKISSKDARRLLGTFYLSRGLLKIDSNNPVADQSAYTVIVSRHLRLTGKPNLVMNAMYSSTDVPVPEGVGPNGSAISLVK